MRVVLKRGSNQGFPANSRSTATAPEHTQSPEPSDAPGIVQVQARRITTRTRPYLLVRGSCGIEVWHDVSKLAPDVGIGSQIRRRRSRLDPAPVERDREVVFKVTRLKDRMLLARHLALHHFGDVVEDVEHAMDTFYQAVVEHPGSDWAAGSQLAIGRATVQLGKPFEALADFQRVRNRFPDSPESESALNWLTLIYRLYGVPELGGTVRFSRDASFKPTLSDKFKDVKSVRLSTNGVHLLERGRKRVLTFDRTGKLAGSQKTVDPHDLIVDPRQGVVVSNEKASWFRGSPSCFIPQRRMKKKGPNSWSRFATR